VTADVRDRVWLCLVIASGLAGAWLGISPGVPGSPPVAAFALLAVWVLGLTWLIAGRTNQ
jgi:hypothetical protein